MKRLKGLLITVAIVAAVLISTELILRVTKPDYPEIYRFTHQQPPPRAFGSYFTPEYVDELWWANPAWKQTIDGLSGDSKFEGKWINFKHGIRATVGQPTNATRTVHILGNSTLLSQFLPDEFTIPSQLQRRLNGVGMGWKVINYGTNGPTAAIQLQILRGLTLKKGDVVIFYDGFVEVAAVYNQLKRELPLFCSNDQQLELVRHFCDALFHFRLDAASGDIQAQLKRYKEALIAAQHYTVAQGASFYHFIQPHLFATTLNDYERAELYPNPYLVWPDMDRLIAKMWDDLVVAFKPTVDLTHALDTLRAQGANLFIDMDHCNEIANGVIADAVYKTLVPQLPDF